MYSVELRIPTETGVFVGGSQSFGHPAVPESPADKLKLLENHLPGLCCRRSFDANGKKVRELATENGWVASNPTEVKAALVGSGARTLPTGILGAIGVANIAYRFDGEDALE